MAKFSNEKDVDESLEMGKRGEGGDYIKLTEGSNFIIILDDEYEQGYSHWVTTDAKTFKRTCKADSGDKGWDPEGCELCALALEMYENKKAAKLEGDATLANDYNDRGNKIRSNFSASMRAIKGKAVIERVVVKGKGGATKKVKKIVPDFEEYEVGLLNLTYSQIQKLFALKDDDGFPQIEEHTDLIGRAINFKKEKVGNKTYAEVTEIIPAKKPFDIETLEIDEESLSDPADEYPEAEDMEAVVELYMEELEGNDEEEYEEEEMKKSKPSAGKKKASGTHKKKVTTKKEEPEEEEDDFEDDEIF